MKQAAAYGSVLLIKIVLIPNIMKAAQPPSECLTLASYADINNEEDLKGEVPEGS